MTKPESYTATDRRPRAPELLAPAGDFDCALAAFAAGADAVYLGLKSFSARAEAGNFTLAQLREILAFARSLSPGRKIYVTLNTLVYEAEIPALCDTLAALSDIRPDALIVQDLGVAAIARRCFPSLELHASTQLVAHNIQGVRALAALGFSRVVAARELSLEELRGICARGGAEIEVFVHGALCYSISGLCLFSAVENARSGNRGRCAYCCRQSCETPDGRKILPFSMRDLRLDGFLGELAAAGAASLKIEGRMKSPLYVASAISYYRHLLDGEPGGPSVADLETVFSRRTTSFYIPGADRPAEEILDGESLGHLGTRIGTLKRVTKDREGRSWIRFRTERALELHDGLQFVRPGLRPFGLAVTALRTAISRRPAFSVPADSDVEVFLPVERIRELSRSGESPLREGAAVYCSASEAVRRAFPVPSFRPSSVDCGTPAEISVSLSPDGVSASAPAFGVTVSVAAPLEKARNSALTPDAVRKAFSRTGGTEWSFGGISVLDPDSLFAPPAALNALRRELVAKLAAAAADSRARRAAEAFASLPAFSASGRASARSLKIRLDQVESASVEGFAETVVSIGRASSPGVLSALSRPGFQCGTVRLALPVWTRDCDFPALAETVRALAGNGFVRWEAADLAGLSLLRESGVEDVTADWTLYAFNRAACAQLAALGVRRFTVSPENTRENIENLSRVAAPEPVFLEEQRIPLFISAVKPGTRGAEFLRLKSGAELGVSSIDGLWITARKHRTKFNPPPGASTRLDLSWDKYALPHKSGQG